MMIFHDWTQTEIIDGAAAWYQYQPGASGHHIIYDSSGNDRHIIGDAGDAPVLTENVLAGQPAWIFAGTETPLSWSGLVTIKHAFILVANTDSTFDGYQGLLTGETVGDVLVGQDATTKFFNLGLDNHYTKEGTSFAESNQQAPMGGNFRLLEVKNFGGITLDGIQVGQQRDFTDRKWKGSFVEMIIFDRILTTAEIKRVRLYFNIKFGEWRRGLPFYFPSADITPTIGPSRFYDAPQDFARVTDEWEYEDGGKDFNLVADHGALRFEYAYPAVPKNQLPIYNEFWNQAQLVNKFYFRDPEGLTWPDVRIEEFNRNHDAHKRWRHDVAFRLVTFNPNPVTDAPPAEAPEGLDATAISGSSIVLTWSIPLDTEAPTAPVLSSATADSDTEITIVWAASSDNIAVTGYETRIDGGAWSDRGNVLTYQYTGLNDSTEYDFEVRAYDAEGNRSPASNLLSATTDAGAGPGVILLDSVLEGSTDGNDFPTSAIDSTGATLLVVAVSFYGGAGAGTIADSKSNTWTSLTTQLEGTPYSRIYYCEAPNAGTGHTFEWIGATGNRPAICAMAFGDAGAYDAQESGDHAFDQTLQPGSITPSEDNCLIVTALASQTGGADSINSGFTLVGALGDVTDEHLSLAVAYKVQTAAAAVNPTWATNLGFSQAMATTMAVFRHE